MKSRAEIVEYARSWIGVRYRHQGRTRRHGLDCAGLLARVGNDLGILEFDSHNYHRFPTDNSFYKVFLQGGFVRTEDPKAGTIAIMKVAGVPCHTGILTGEGTVIHSYAPYRKVIETVFDPESADAYYEFPLTNG